MNTKESKTIKKERWIDDTHLFQRIAGVPETPTEELETEWDSFKKNPRVAEVEFIPFQVVIAQIARRTVKARRS